MTTFSQFLELVNAARAADKDIIANQKAQLEAKDAKIAQLESDDLVEDANYEKSIGDLQQEKATLEKAAADIQAQIDAAAAELKDAPAEETPAGETPVEEAPVEETPVEETPAEESTTL